MHILFVTHYSGFYGANKSMLALIRLLRENHDVQATVLLPNQGVMCDVLQQNNIPFVVSHYYWWVNDNHGLFQKLLNKRKQLLNYCHLSNIIRALGNQSFDLVYSNSVTVNIGLFIAQHFHIPHIWHFRESLVQFNLSLSLSLFLSLSLLHRSINSAYILISHYMMDYYSTYLPADRMHCIYNGVSLPQGVSRKEPNTLTGHLKVVCIGVLCEQKNQLELLRAQAVLYRRGVIIETYFLGSAKADYLQQMQSFILSNNLSSYAHILGHTDDIYSTLQSMNIGVVCAHDEAFGRVTIEEMLMHLPVIVSRSGANAELLREGVDGIVYPLGDTNALAEALMSYVLHPEQLSTHGGNAYQHALEHFSAQQNAEQIYQLIKNIP
jgi:L-malate glycosyltransferase